MVYKKQAFKTYMKPYTIYNPMKRILLENQRAKSVIDPFREHPKDQREQHLVQWNGSSQFCFVFIGFAECPKRS